MAERSGFQEEVDEKFKHLCFTSFDASETEPAPTVQVVSSADKRTLGFLFSGEGRKGLNVFEDDDLTAEQISELKEAFAHYDKSGKGVISVHDLKSVMRIIGMNPTENEIVEIMNGLDIDANGEIELHEFIAVMLQKMQTLDTEAEIKKVFQVFDRDGNGSLSIEELKYMMVHALGHRITEQEVDEMFQEADIDGDGRLDYGEFVKMLLDK